MTQNQDSQVLSCLGSMLIVCKITISKKFGIKKYAWKVAIIQKILVTIADFSFVTLFA